MSFLDKYTARDIETAPETKPQFPVGEVHARIIGATLNNTRAGDEMIVVTFGNAAGAEINDYITDNEWAVRKLKNLMTSFRIPFEQYNRFWEWAGHEGIVVTKEGEPYNGKVYPKVSHYRSIKDAATTPAPMRKPQPAPETGDDIPF